MKRKNPTTALLLVCSGLALGSVELLHDRLSLDATASSTCAWEAYRSDGLSSGRFDFLLPTLPLGLTGRAGQIAVLRAYTDVTAPTAMPMREFYVELHWQSGWTVRGGQFVPPYSREALTPYQDLWFADYSLLRDWWTHCAPTDVGVQSSYSAAEWSVTAAVINGNGGRAPVDDNPWKDVCVRMTLSPRTRGFPSVAARWYSGRTDVGVPFRSVEGEIWLETGHLPVVAQVQSATKGPYTRTAVSLQAACFLADWMTPAIRVQSEFQNDDRYLLITSGMMNFRLLDETIVAGLGGDFQLKESNTSSARFTKQRVLLRLLVTL